MLLAVTVPTEEMVLEENEVILRRATATTTYRLVDSSSSVAKELKEPSPPVDSVAPQTRDSEEDNSSIAQVKTFSPHALAYTLTTS